MSEIVNSEMPSLADDPEFSRKSSWLLTCGVCRHAVEGDRWEAPVHGDRRDLQQVEADWAELRVLDEAKLGVFVSVQTAGFKVFRPRSR